MGLRPQRRHRDRLPDPDHFAADGQDIAHGERTAQELQSRPVEKRCFHRYQLSTPLTGFVEQEGERFTGSILNISSDGFSMHLPDASACSLATYGASDYGEIRRAGRIVHGFGQIVRIEPLAKGVGVGFSWDINEIDDDGGLLIAEIIEEQIAVRRAGYVKISAGDIVLGGHISSALTSEIFSCSREIGKGAARLSLLGSVSIDSSGVEMLLTLREMNVCISDVGEEIKSVVQRFQLFPEAPQSVASGSVNAPA